jgi:anti-anti-sigma factor
VAFEVDVVRRGSAEVLSVRGELDIATAPRLEEAAAATTGRLVVDLTGTTFLDSTGLRSLIALAKDDGRDVAVVCPQDNRAVILVLELSGFETILERFETLEDAGVDVS